MSLLAECLAELKCFQTRFKSSERVAVSCGREFQVAGAEQRKARLPKALLEKGSDSAVAEYERTVRRMYRALMCRLTYDDVEVMRTLNVSTANLYEICCLTGSQCSWWSSG